MDVDVLAKSTTNYKQQTTQRKQRLSDVSGPGSNPSGTMSSNVKKKSSICCWRRSFYDKMISRMSAAPFAYVSKRFVHIQLGNLNSQGSFPLCCIRFNFECFQRLYENSFLCLAMQQKANLLLQSFQKRLTF